MNINVFILIVILTPWTANALSGSGDVSSGDGEAEVERLYSGEDILRAIEEEERREGESDGESGSSEDEDEYSDDDNVSGSSPNSEPETSSSPTIVSPRTTGTIATDTLVTGTLPAGSRSDDGYSGSGSYNGSDSGDRKDTGNKGSRMEFAHLENAVDVMKRLKKTTSDEELAKKIKSGPENLGVSFKTFEQLSRLWISILHRIWRVWKAKGAKQVMHSIVNDLVARTGSSVTPRLGNLLQQSIKSATDKGFPPTNSSSKLNYDDPHSGSDAKKLETTSKLHMHTKQTDSSPPARKNAMLLHNSSVVKPVVTAVKVGRSRHSSQGKGTPVNKIVVRFSNNTSEITRNEKTAVTKAEQTEGLDKEKTSSPIVIVESFTNNMKTLEAKRGTENMSASQQTHPNQSGLQSKSKKETVRVIFDSKDPSRSRTKNFRPRPISDERSVDKSGGSAVDKNRNHSQEKKPAITIKIEEKSVKPVTIKPQHGQKVPSQFQVITQPKKTTKHTTLQTLRTSSSKAMPLKQTTRIHTTYSTHRTASSKHALKKVEALGHLPRDKGTASKQNTTNNAKPAAKLDKETTPKKEVNVAHEQYHDNGKTNQRKPTQVTQEKGVHEERHTDYGIGTNKQGSSQSNDIKKRTENHVHSQSHESKKGTAKTNEQDHQNRATHNNREKESTKESTVTQSPPTEESSKKVVISTKTVGKYAGPKALLAEESNNHRVEVLEGRVKILESEVTVLQTAVAGLVNQLDHVQHNVQEVPSVNQSTVITGPPEPSQPSQLPQTQQSRIAMQSSHSSPVALETQPERMPSNELPGPQKVPLWIALESLLKMRARGQEKSGTESAVVETGGSQGPMPPPNLQMAGPSDTPEAQTPSPSDVPDISLPAAVQEEPMMTAHTMTSPNDVMSTPVMTSPNDVISTPVMTSSNDGMSTPVMMSPNDVMSTSLHDAMSALPSEPSTSQFVRPIVNIIVRNSEAASALENAMCQSTCKNGGKCVGPNTCKCPTLFNGDRCERFSLFDLIKSPKDWDNSVWKRNKLRPLSARTLPTGQRISISDLIRLGAASAARFGLPSDNLYGMDAGNPIKRAKLRILPRRSQTGNTAEPQRKQYILEI